MDGWRRRARSRAAEFLRCPRCIHRAFADRARFPALRDVVIAGHSGGAQVAHRYAIVGAGCNVAGVRCRYVIANPSSYVYFDSMRPYEDGVLRPADTTACPAWMTGSTACGARHATRSPRHSMRSNTLRRKRRYLSARSTGLRSAPRRARPIVCGRSARVSSARARTLLLFIPRSPPRRAWTSLYGSRRRRSQALRCSVRTKACERCSTHSVCKRGRFIDRRRDGLDTAQTITTFKNVAWATGTSSSIRYVVSLLVYRQAFVWFVWFVWFL